MRVQAVLLAAALMLVPFGARAADRLMKSKLARLEVPTLH
jgi:hypothetical protein